MAKAIEPVLDDAALYVGDNGRLACGEHAGASARFTGRDISGQRVEKVTRAMVEASKLPADWWVCEDCGRRI